VYDPKVTPALIRSEVQGGGAEDPLLSVASTPYEAAAGSHAIAIVTEWDEFKSLNFEKIYASMAKPAMVFDGRNILDLKRLSAIGFRTHAIGK